MLSRQHPAIERRLFAKLPRATRREAALVTSMLLHCLEDMSTGADGYGSEGIEARKALEARGLTANVVAEAQGLVDGLRRITDESTMTEEERRANDRAEAALWAWYCEWSRIARVAIQSRGVLRQLGLASLRRTESRTYVSGTRGSCAGLQPSGRALNIGEGYVRYDI